MKNMNDITIRNVKPFWLQNILEKTILGSGGRPPYHDSDSGSRTEDLKSRLAAVTSHIIEENYKFYRSSAAKF